MKQGRKLQGVLKRSGKDYGLGVLLVVCPDMEPYFALIVFQEDGRGVSRFFWVTDKAIDSYFKTLALTFVSFSEFRGTDSKLNSITVISWCCHSHKAFLCLGLRDTIHGRIFYEDVVVIFKFSCKEFRGFSCKEFIKGRGLVISINEEGQFHGGKFPDFKK